MDTRLLVEETKARFAHNIAKDYLKNKYTGKLIIAEQNGLWKIDTQFIAFLSSVTTETVVIVDQYNNPVQVNTKELLEVAINTYHRVMTEWYDEHKKLENKR